MPIERVIVPVALKSGAKSDRITQAAPLAFKAEVATKRIADRPQTPVARTKGSRGSAPRRLACLGQGKYHEIKSGCVLILCEFLFLHAFLSQKHKLGAPALAPTKVLKTSVTLTAGAVARQIPWVDVSWGTLQRGVEEARLALGEQASRVDALAEATPTPVEATPVLSAEGSMYAKVTSTVVPPIPVGSSCRQLWREVRGHP